jgi:septal ring factor EnvC (AmiA/AmiB activator)
LPKLRSLAQLRSLLPYAAKILPVLTGVAVGDLPVQRPDLSALNRHFGEMQNESRGLRSRVEGQSEQIGRVQEQIDRLAPAIETLRREQQELATAFRSLAALLKGLFFAILFLLVAITTICALMLFRISHT